MSDDASTVAGMAIGSVVGGFSVAFFAGASSWAAIKAYRGGRFARGWFRLRVWGLGGVTTLGRALAYDCSMCHRSLDRGEEVRTLSCTHTFHLLKSDKCAHIVDDWLRENRMLCPTCCKTAYPVWPWKAPPTSAPPPATEPVIEESSASDLEAQLPPLAPPRPPPSEWFQDTLLSPSPRSSTSGLEAQLPPQGPPRVSRSLPSEWLQDTLLSRSPSPSPSPSQAPPSPSPSPSPPQAPPPPPPPPLRSHL